MAEVQPPLYLNLQQVYQAADLGLPLGDLVAEGVVGAGDLAVSQRGAGANMSVDVAAGTAYVEGDTADEQPTYRVRNDATRNLTIDAADATNPRIDLVVAEVLDAAFTGASNLWRLRVVKGTPAAGPTPPATPDTALVLAQVTVAAAAASITDAAIADSRPRAQGGASPLGAPLVTALPPAPLDGTVVDFLADPASGVTWRLRYREAQSGSYKWLVIGGPPLAARDDADEGTASTTFAALGGVDAPIVTPPLDGVYDLEFGAHSYNSGANGNVVGAEIGGSVFPDNVAQVDHSAATRLLPHHQRLQRLTLTAGGQVALKYKVSAGGGQFRWRWLTLTPIRLGG